MLIGKREPYRLGEGIIDYKSGTRQNIALDRNYHNNGIMCTLTVEHNNTTGAVFNDPQLLSLISSIEIVGNGSERFKTITPDKIWLNEIKNFGKQYTADIKTNIASNLTSKMTFFIPFTMLQMVRGEDTILDTSKFTSLNLFVNWGGNTSIGTNIAVTSANIQAFSMGVKGHTYAVNEPLKYYIENTNQEEVTSTTNNFTIKLPDGKFYKGFAISSKVAGMFDDGVISNIKLKSGSTVFIDWSADAIRALNQREMNIKTASILKGLYYLEVTARGKMSDMINTATKYKTLELEFVVAKGAGTTTIEVNTDEVEFTNIIPNKG